MSDHNDVLARFFELDAHLRQVVAQGGAVPEAAAAEHARLRQAIAGLTPPSPGGAASLARGRGLIRVERPRG